MEIQFDRSLQFQLDAIASITDIFRDQEKHISTFTVNSPEYINNQVAISTDDLGYSNQLMLSEENIVENVQKIQLCNGLKPSSSNEIDTRCLNFTVEMETGTGKTYVYLRTIIELYMKYGFSKHIIVVPSISIKEGVYKSLQITKNHFKEIYNRVRYQYFVYDSGNLNDVRDFAVDNSLKIMVINIDAFSKSFNDPSSANRANIIHRYNDTLGCIPLNLIKSTRPVVIVDEPQTTMSTALRKSAIKSLDPLTILRYSATHVEKINQMYKLNAVDAYTQKLVKQIEVGSTQTQSVKNEAYIRLLEVISGNGLPKAKIEIDAFVNESIKRKRLVVGQNSDLEQLTGRSEYAGYIVKDIYAYAGNEYIDFTSRDEYIRLGEAIGDVDDLQVKTLMIEKTIEEHLDKELVLNKQGIKVLSLFFIDKVANYRTYDHEGNSNHGEYARIFEERYSILIKKPKYDELCQNSHFQDASLVHNGYFSIDQRGQKFRDTRGDSKVDEDTYNLIMRDKERLLSFDSDVRFIFTHSALREGWDNPNVFQICTLKSMGRSFITPRQQIGRGLRLCVNKEGYRVHGHKINTLTVIVNESWENFVSELQREIEEESGIKFGYLSEDSFSGVVTEIKNGENILLGFSKSVELYTHFLNEGYINQLGKVEERLRIALLDQRKIIPKEFYEYDEYDEYVISQIINILKGASGKLKIKNKENKTKVRVNREILHSKEFKELWDRVKFKTTFSIEFDSRSLAQQCINALNSQLQIHRGKIIYEKKSLQLSLDKISNDESDNMQEDHRLEYQVLSLPDIVGYLQNKTQLTRKTIVDILKETSKLDYFKINPQKFIEGCIDIINTEMRNHIVDGIKYHKIGDNEYYSQELFENEELYGYLEENLNPSSKSPYEHVVYDSKTEKNLSSQFEQSQNISVYAKLPSWFKIDTPLGTYNPDWVISWRQGGEEKIYFVVESKGSTLMDDLRRKEGAKIKCGEKHFHEMESRLMVVRDINDIRNNT